MVGSQISRGTNSHSSMFEKGTVLEEIRMSTLTIRMVAAKGLRVLAQLDQYVGTDRPNHANDFSLCHTGTQYL